MEKDSFAKNRASSKRKKRERKLQESSVSNFSSNHIQQTAPSLMIEGAGEGWSKVLLIEDRKVGSLRSPYGDHCYFLSSLMTPT